MVYGFKLSVFSNLANAVSHNQSIHIIVQYPLGLNAETICCIKIYFNVV